MCRGPLRGAVCFPDRIVAPVGFHALGAFDVVVLLMGGFVRVVSGDWAAGLVAGFSAVYNVDLNGWLG